MKIPSQVERYAEYTNNGFNLIMGTARELDQDGLLKCIKEFVVQMNRCSTKEQIYVKLASWVSKLTNAERASVTLADPSSKTFEIFGLSGEAGLLPVGKQIPIDGTVAGIAFNERKAMLFNFDSYPDALDCQMLSQQGFVATINAPLSVDGVPIGTLNIATARSNNFDDSTRYTMETLASMVSSSLSRYDLLQRLKDAAARLRTQANCMRSIAASSSRLSDAESIEELFRQTCKVVGELAPVKDAGFFELEPQEGTVVQTQRFRAGLFETLVHAPINELRPSTPISLVSPIRTTEWSDRQAGTRPEPLGLGDWILPVNVLGETEYLIGIELQCSSAIEVDLFEPLSILSNIIGATVDRMRVRAKIEERVYQDELTGLLNRAGFNQRLNELMVDEGGKRFALIIADLNKFKHLNDHYGHWTGDVALKSAAKLLQELAGSGNHVCRIGGDEFAILAADTGDAGGTRERIIERLNNCRLAIEADGENVDIKLSFGAAFYPEDATKVSSLMKHADLAMYAAKRAGQGHVETFEPDMAHEFDRRVELRSEFRSAAVSDQIVPYYHPLINLYTGMVEGVEALARWNHPQRGWLAPGQFQFIFEDRELKALLARRMVDCAVADMCAWRELGVAYESVGVNVEITDLEDPTFLRYVERTLMDSKVPARDLAFEITEHSKLNIGNKDLMKHLRKVRSAGMYIALDDFGTGYSSLAHVKDLPLTALKLDKSFVHEITNCDKEFVIARCLMDMAKGLGVKSIAEGIETPEQRAVLQALNCDMGQGYLFTKPVPSCEVPKLIANLNAIADFTAAQRLTA